MDTNSTLIEALSEQLGMTREAVTERLGAFEVIPFEYKGEITGYALLSGSEIHFWSKPEYRGHCGTRRELFDLFRRLLAKRHYLTTRIPIDTPPKDRTGERLGFTWAWRDDRFDYYILTDLPFRRRICKH
jgi:hypothetical protein